MPRRGSPAVPTPLQQQNCFPSNRHSISEILGFAASRPRCSCRHSRLRPRICCRLPFGPQRHCRSDPTRRHPCRRPKFVSIPRILARSFDVGCMPSGRSLRRPSFRSSQRHWRLGAWRHRRRCLGCTLDPLLGCRRRLMPMRLARTFRCSDCRLVRHFECRRGSRLLRLVRKFPSKDYRRCQPARRRLDHREWQWTHSSHRARHDFRSRRCSCRRRRRRASCSSSSCNPTVSGWVRPSLPKST
jgi:hypothetical protein